MELFNCTDSAESADSSLTDAINELLEKIKEISPDARDNALNALLYGSAEHSPVNPPLASIYRFLRKVFAAAEKAKDAISGDVYPMAEQVRCLAEQARTDRLDPDTEQVQKAAFKVVREFDRLRGLLRFKTVFPDKSVFPDKTLFPEKTANPNADSEEHGTARYIARCAPDHFVLPLLADHFWQRFGKNSNISWAIIDEKRKLVLFCEKGREPELLPLNAIDKIRDDTANPKNDEWEGLWKNYHHSINNEDRSNSKLQLQFMPRRYRKYLTEFL